MSLMKEQDKTSEKGPNKIQTSSLPSVEFKTLIIRKVNKHRGRLDELSENFKKNG